MQKVKEIKDFMIKIYFDNVKPDVFYDSAYSKEDVLEYYRELYPDKKIIALQKKKR